MVHFENGLATQVAVRWSSVRKIFGRAKLLLSLISVGSAGASPSQTNLLRQSKKRYLADGSLQLETRGQRLAAHYVEQQIAIVNR